LPFLEQAAERGATGQPHSGIDPGMSDQTFANRKTLSELAQPKSSASASLRGVVRLEHRGEPLASRRVFAARVSLAVLVWMAAATLSLLVGIGGYAAFEHMPLADAFVSAAMVLSGMGEAVSLKTTGGKVFAGLFALFSGLFMLVATGVVLAPIIHRILHRFHVGRGKDD
jgi:hypothetical protein